MSVYKLVHHSLLTPSLGSATWAMQSTAHGPILWPLPHPLRFEELPPAVTDLAHFSLHAFPLWWTVSPQTSLPPSSSCEVFAQSNINVVSSVTNVWWGYISNNWELQPNEKRGRILSRGMSVVLPLCGCFSCCKIYFYFYYYKIAASKSSPLHLSQKIKSGSRQFSVCPL